MQDDVADLDTQLEYLEGALRGLDDGDGSIPAGKSREVQNAKQRQAELRHQIGELLCDMETGTQIVDQFKVRTIVWLSWQRAFHLSYHNVRIIIRMLLHKYFTCPTKM